MPTENRVVLGNEVPPEVQQEMLRQSHELFAKLVPILEGARYDVACMTMCMLLGQNIAYALKNTSEHTLETLVDRITLSVRTSAEASLADDDSNESHRNN